jgi:HK97 family phage major capsid protein
MLPHHPLGRRACDLEIDMQTKNTVPDWAQNHSESAQASILALQGKANSALSRARALEAKAQNEGRDLTDDELTFCDSQMDSFVKFTNEVDGFKSAGRKVGPQAVASPAPRSFAAMFKNQDTRSQFENLGDFARAVYTRNPSLYQFQNASGMQTLTGSEGGYFVPSPLLASIMDNSLQTEVVRGLASVIAMPAGTCTVPAFDLSNRSSSLAGLEPATTAEGATASNQKAVTRSITLTARKLVVMVPCTEELIQDSGNAFQMLLTNYMQQSLSQKLDDDFLNGSGSGQSLGIINAPATISVAKETSQVAATVVPQNLANMVSRLAPGSFGRAVWLCHPSVLASLFTMQNVVRNQANTENVGGSTPGWFSVSPTGQMSLLGRPLLVSDRCQQLGTKGDILLADLQSYLIGIVGDARLQVDSSVGLKEGEIYFKLSMRVDGQPLQAAPITPRNGSSTLSPFVTLATRS